MSSAVKSVSGFSKLPSHFIEHQIINCLDFWDMIALMISCKSIKAIIDKINWNRSRHARHILPCQLISFDSVRELQIEKVQTIVREMRALFPQIPSAVVGYRQMMSEALRCYLAHSDQANDFFEGHFRMPNGLHAKDHGIRVY